MTEVVTAWFGLNFGITGIGLVTAVVAKFLKGGLG